MKDFKRILLIAVMLCTPAISAFAQEQRPPKQPPDIEEGRKPKPTPTPDPNRGNDPKKGGDDKRGKP